MDIHTRLYQNVQNLSSITTSECAESVRHYNIRMCRLCLPLQHHSVQNLSSITTSKCAEYIRHYNIRMCRNSAIATSECAESVLHYNIRMCRICPPLQPQNVQNLSVITTSKCAESVRHYNTRGKREKLGRAGGGGGEFSGRWGEGGARPRILQPALQYTEYIVYE